MSRLLVFILWLPFCVLGQESNISNSSLELNAAFDAHYFYGTMLRHNENVGHLIQAHPEGLILSFNKKTNGSKYWQEAYGYPDWGVSFLYQDFKTEALGENYGLYGHYNFYFFKERLQLRLAQGAAFNTNPFDLETNFKNNVYGSSFLFSSYVLLNYTVPNIYKGFGVQAGLTLVHHSNGSFRAPNSGTNVAALNLGLNYDVNYEQERAYLVDPQPKSYEEKVTYNFLIRAGLNEGDFYNLGQHPFVVVSAFADKRLNYKSTLQLGVEVFFSKFLEKEIEYRSVAFPTSGLTGDEDYKRVGVFVGHEFRLGKFAIPTQLGYYVYWPYEYEIRSYQRVGVKYYITDHVFGIMSVKTHAANAEAMEFGIGIRL